MKTNKADLIKKAAGNAAHKRSDVRHKEITTDSISFKVGESKALLESFKPNSRSAAMRAALKFADENGELDEYKL